MKRKDLGNASKALYLLPMFIGLYLFKFWPLIQVIIISFKEDYNYASKENVGIGLANYEAIFNDHNFIQAVYNTATYVIFVVVFTVIISFFVSWCLFRIKKFTHVFRTVIFLPLISSDIAIGICWRFMFNDRGIINALLNKIGLPAVAWLTDKDLSLLSLILYGIWISLPISILLIYSSMQKINSHLLLSAKIDNTGEIKTLLRIVVPILKPTIVMVAVINTISAWLAFNGLFPLFSGLPGPYFNLYTVVYYIYSKSGEGVRNLGSACAASVVLLLLVTIFLIIRCFYGNKKERFGKGC